MSEADILHGRAHFEEPDAAELEGRRVAGPPPGWAGWREWAAEPAHPLHLPDEPPWPAPESTFSAPALSPTESSSWKCQPAVVTRATGYTAECSPGPRHRSQEVPPTLLTSGDQRRNQLSSPMPQV